LYFLYLLCKKNILGIRFFFNRLYRIFSNFSAEWNVLVEEERRIPHFFFIVYLSILVAISFFIGAIVYSEAELGLYFILSNSVLILFFNLCLVFFLAYFLGKFLAYYTKQNIEKTVQLLVIYSFSAYLAGEVIGYLTSPEDFFFLAFLASSFAAFYLYQGLFSILTGASEVFLFGMSIFFFILLIISYFLTNNMLTILM